MMPPTLQGKYIFETIKSEKVAEVGGWVMRQGQCSISVALISDCVSSVTWGAFKASSHLGPTESESLGWDPGVGIFKKCPVYHSCAAMREIH